MGYFINFNEKSIQGFKEKLKATKLLPSQKVLEELMDEGFEYLEQKGIENIGALEQILKKKEDALEVAKQSNMPDNFWIVLRRELNGYHPQPRKLKDFTVLDPQLVESLEANGIKTTLQLYEVFSDDTQRASICTKVNISEEVYKLLCNLIDFCRLRYINADFATLMVNSNYNTIDKLKQANFNDLHVHLLELNADKKFYKAKITLNDMELIIRDANYFGSGFE